MTIQSPPPTPRMNLETIGAIIATVDAHAGELGKVSGICYKNRAETVVEHRPALTTAKGTFAMATKPICSISDCDKPSSIRGWCNVHYKRWLAHGDPLAGRAPNGAARKFIEAAVASQTDDCIIWPYQKNEKGYGRINISRVPRGAHRVVCGISHGPAPSPTHEAAHDCGVPACVNPRHLRWATQLENQADVDRHGRRTYAKLSEADVREIRALYGSVDGTELAKRFGVSQSTISDIHRGNIWRRVKP